MAASSHWENVLAAIQVPFPELTDLVLKSAYETALVVPDTFLGGSAHRLRFLRLNRVQFSELPKLLLSATGTHLVYLQLWNIPRYSYFTQGDGHLPLTGSFDQARTTLAHIRITSISSGPV